MLYIKSNKSSEMGSCKTLLSRICPIAFSLYIDTIAFYVLTVYPITGKFTF